MRKTINNTAPWLPWLASGLVGTLDAANVIDRVSTPLYVALIVGGATVTILTRGPRIVCDMLAHRWDHAAEQAQLQEATKLAYQIQFEHCESHRQANAGELPQAVGESTDRLSRSLHVVRSPATDAAATRGQAYRRKTSIGRATVPQQSQPVQLASAQRLRRQP